MTNATNAATEINGFELPARLGWKTDGTLGVKGEGDTDAGWTVIHCADREDALRVMLDYPAARMPCWSRIE